MKKWMAILMVTVIIFSAFTGCSPAATEPSENLPSEPTQPSETDDGEDTKESATIAPQVLYDANNIKITLTNFGYDLAPAAENVVVVGGGAWLNLSIDNNTDGEVYIGCPYAVVNGFMIEPRLQCRPAAGETLDETLELDRDELIMSGVSTVGSVWFIISITDVNTDTSIDTKYIQLSTSAADYVQPEYTPSVEPLLDENGTKAFYLGSEYDGYSWIYRVYLENSTDEIVSLNLEAPMADGTDAFGHTHVCNGVLFPDSAAFAEIRVQTGDEDYTGAEAIDALTGMLKITQYGDDSTVYASTPVSLTLQDLIY